METWIVMHTDPLESGNQNGGGEDGTERDAQDKGAIRGARAAPGKGGYAPRRLRSARAPRTDRPRPAGPLGPQAQGAGGRKDRPRRGLLRSLHGRPRPRRPGSVAGLTPPRNPTAY